MELLFVDQAALSDVWPIARDNINKALEYSSGRYNEKTVVDGLVSGAMQLWIAVEDGNIHMSLITQIMTYPTGLKVCEIFVLGGLDRNKWLEPGTKVITKYAKELGCSRLQMIGRKGWERVLKDWKSVTIMLEQSLGD